MLSFSGDFMKESTLCFIVLKQFEQIEIKFNIILSAYWEKTMVSPLNPLSANPTKWSNALKQFVGKLPTNCLSVFGNFVNLALKGWRYGEAILILKCSNHWEETSYGAKSHMSGRGIMVSKRCGNLGQNKSLLYKSLESGTRISDEKCSLSWERKMIKGYCKKL